MAVALLDHEKVIEKMAALNLTQERLAEEVGITDRYLRRLRKGNVNTSTTLLYRLSQVFQVPIDSLLVLQEEEKKG